MTNKDIFINALLNILKTNGASQALVGEFMGSNAEENDIFFEQLIKYQKQKAIIVAEFVGTILSKKIPHGNINIISYSSLYGFDCEMISSLLRRKIVPFCGFAFLSESWIKPLAEWIGNRKCLEVMCGCGSLSKCLREYGVNIIATDVFTEDYTWDFFWIDDIEKIDACDAIEKYHDQIDIVIMSWPTYDTDDAYKTLLCARKYNLTIIYIGESKGGCTANDEFFDNMIAIHDESLANVQGNFTRWSLLHDTIALIK